MLLGASPPGRGDFRSGKMHTGSKLLRRLLRALPHLRSSPPPALHHRAPMRVSKSLVALGNIDTDVPSLEPERLASTDPDAAITKVIGSGPLSPPARAMEPGRFIWLPSRPTNHHFTHTTLALLRLPDKTLLQRQLSGLGVEQFQIHRRGRPGRHANCPEYARGSLPRHGWAGPSGR